MRSSSFTGVDHSFQFSVDHRTIKPVSLNDVFQFVAQDEPKIVNAVKSERQTDDRRPLVKPATDAIDFAGWERFYKHKPDTAFHQDTGHLAQLFWITP